MTPGHRRVSITKHYGLGQLGRSRFRLLAKHIGVRLAVQAGKEWSTGNLDTDTDTAMNTNVNPNNPNPTLQVFDESALMLGLRPTDVRGMLFEDALVQRHQRMLTLAAQAMGTDLDMDSQPKLNPNLTPNINPNPDHDPDPSLNSNPNPCLANMNCDPAALQILVAEAIGQRVELERKIMHERHKENHHRIYSGSGQD